MVGCPSEDIVASPISSNLVEYTEPPAGDVIESFGQLTIKFLKPIDEATFSVDEDVRVTRQRAAEPPEAIDLFLPGISHPSPDEATLQVDPAVVLEPGDIVKVSVLGYDEIEAGAVTSLPDHPRPGDQAVRLARTVSVRLRVADPEMGLPQNPYVGAYPQSFRNDPIDPDEVGGLQTWVAPHEKLIIRFSEPMGAVSIHGEVVSTNSTGSVAGLDFRSFRGLNDSSSVSSAHTAIIRNGMTGLVIGATYELNILGHDTLDPRLPASKDLSGQPIMSTFTKYFRTSHVSIEAPIQSSWVDTDLRGDFFIQARYMLFKVTELVKWIEPHSGVQFTRIDVSDAPDPQYPTATDVELAPDGTGRLCVAAYAEDGGLLGIDCLRVYDEENLKTTGVVGREGGKISVGKYEVSFSEANAEVELDDGTVVELPPTLRDAVEIAVERKPEFPVSGFSLLDTYGVTLPDGVSLETPAIVSLDFDPAEQGLPDDPVNLVLGTRDSNGAFIQYPRQFLLPWKKTALAYSFSDTDADEKEESKDCNEGFEEVPRCCEGQQYYQCDPCGSWCNCHLCGQLTSDIGICECDHPPNTPMCCYGCENAEEECPQCTGDGMVCDQATLEEASKKKCVVCEVNDCWDLDNAVSGGDGKTGGKATCYCGVSSSTQITCTSQPNGSVCCSLTDVGGDSSCTIVTSDWTGLVPESCLDALAARNEDLQNHEEQHAYRDSLVCDGFLSDLSNIPQHCGANEEEAQGKIKRLVDEAIEYRNRQMEASREIIDAPGGPFDVRPIDCDCAVE